MKAALTLLMLVAAFGVRASPATTLEKYLSGLSTWSADFEQTISDAQGKAVRSGGGHLYLQRPGKFRWDYVHPSQQLVLSDGKKLWFYDADLAQANVREVDATLASTPAMLLSGGGTVGDEFDIAALAETDGLEWFQLKPKHDAGDFLAARIAFRKGELARMMLADKLNQVTRLDFYHAVRNQPLDATLFRFTPPAGVDVIGR